MEAEYIPLATATEEQSSYTMSAEPIYRTNAQLNLQFVINDEYKAWECAKDTRSFLTVLMPGANISHVGGTEGAIGVTYISTRTVITSNGVGNSRRHKSINQMVHTVSFTVTEIDEGERTVKYTVLGSITLPSAEQQPNQMTVKVGEYSPSGSRVVKITTNDKSALSQIPCWFLVCFGIPFFCCPFIFMHFTKVAEKNEQMKLIARLQHHFTIYQPKATAQVTINDSFGIIPEAQPVYELKENQLQFS